MKSNPIISLTNKIQYPAVSTKSTAVITLARINTLTPPEERKKRVPVSIITVVDQSGSMSGAKIAEVKKTLKLMVLELQDTDKFGIVLYSSVAFVALPPILMTSEGKLRALSIIDPIRCHGSTNLSEGLFTAMKLFSTSSNNNNVISSVLLMTDGHANHGIIDSTGIIEATQHLQGQGFGRGTTINTFGFGSDHNASMLKRISDAGEGMYYFIEDSSSISATIADCLGGIFTVVAQNIELTIEAKEKNSIYDVQVDSTLRKTVEVVPKKKFRISLGDIQEGESRDIPFTCSLTEIDTENDCFPLVKLTLSYFNVNRETLEEIVDIVSIKRVSKLSKEDLVMDEDVSTQCNRYLAAEANKRAVSFADNGKLYEAAAEITSTLNAIKNSASSRNEFCVGLIDELNTAYNNLQSKELYRDRGQQQMNTAYKSFHCQRSSNLQQRFDRPAYFETPARKCMKERFSSGIPHHNRY